MKKKYISPESATYSFISEGALLLNSLTGKSIETKPTIQQLQTTHFLINKDYGITILGRKTKVCYS